MRNPHRILLMAAALLAGAAADFTGAGIVWERDWDGAFARAAAEAKPVFLAVNMDGEKANDVLATKTYHEDLLAPLAARTVNLAASRFEHGGKTCSRFDGLSCPDHQRADVAARGQFLKAGLDGQVIAPQHVWLDGAGKILLSVSYEVSREELAWCFVTAILRVDPKSDVKMPSSARPPRRLVIDGVAGGESVRPLTKEELEKALDALQKGGFGANRVELVTSLLATDHPDAVEAVAKELAGFGLRNGRGGRGGEAEGMLEQIQAARRALVHRIGVVSPASFWKALAEAIEDEDPRMRTEVAAALEQLGAADALKIVRKAFVAEKDMRAEQDFLRAIGACGHEDSGARKVILQHVKDKDAGIRHNAIYAAGLFAAEKDAAEALHAAFASTDALDSQAALLGLAAAGASDFAGAIERLSISKEASAETAALAVRVLAVLKAEAPLSGLGEDVVRVCGDTVRRERFYPMTAAPVPPDQAGGGGANAGTGP